MSNENFEKYISLLKGFLKLDSKQQEEIASELRDHVEHRIEQLTGEGKSVEEAELLAIQEFGDAAGLANSFLNVTRFNRQRWIMRFTTFAIVGSFVVAVFVMSMWPENGRVRMATSQAQEKTDELGGFNSPKSVRANRAKKRIMDSVSRTRSMAEEKAIMALKSEISQFACVETPFKDAIEMLTKETDVPIIISRRYLEDMGVDEDTAISLKIGQAKLTTILEMILGDQCGLDDWVYCVKDSVIFIAGEDSMDQLMEVRVYDCKDFAVEATVTAPMNYGRWGGGFGGGGGGFGGGGMQAGGGGMFCVPTFSVQGLATPPQIGGGSPGKGAQPPKVQNQTPAGSAGGGSGADPMKSGSTPGKTAQSGGVGGTFGNAGGSMDAGYKTFKMQDLSELIECIRETVDTDSWEEMGGKATLKQVGTAIVVKQTIKNHDRLEELLKMLRTAKNQ